MREKRRSRGEGGREEKAKKSEEKKFAREESRRANGSRARFVPRGCSMRPPKHQLRRKSEHHDGAPGAGQERQRPVRSVFGPDKKQQPPAITLGALIDNASFLRRRLQNAFWRRGSLIPLIRACFQASIHERIIMNSVSAFSKRNSARRRRQQEGPRGKRGVVRSSRRRRFEGAATMGLDQASCCFVRA